MDTERKPERRLAWIFVAALGALAAILFTARPAAAQASALDIGPPPPYVEPEAPPAPAEPTFDPLRANKSIEVGQFYMRRGNYDAAIDRFTDATHFEPNLAKSYELLGEAYEHKNDVDGALTAYRKYLDLLRDASDRDKVQKKIDKLEGESGRAQTKIKSG
jgi:tetratricopeptide (TPR) repeat protein